MKVDPTRLGMLVKWVARAAGNEQHQGQKVVYWTYLYKIKLIIA
jgi:hypothetical protein